LHAAAVGAERFAHDERNAAIHAQRGHHRSETFPARR
jgi:hypothetical protein